MDRQMYGWKDGQIAPVFYRTSKPNAFVPIGSDLSLAPLIGPQDWDLDLEA